MNNNYSAFNITINGITPSASYSNINSGFSGTINAEKFEIGNGLKGSYINQLAIWDSDQSLNVLDIYNDGNSLDLTNLTEPPLKLYTMGDSYLDIFPHIFNYADLNDTTSFLTMINQTSSNIVNIAPP